ncbi:hypothetical protein [Xanthomonas sp. BRIP62411]|uniref:hypothetical protein n=1 Tax=Xanthomonas sp. BRIP62411 TaxID=2182389 RepID=UPI000F8CECFE|nr:hypothetical protein [Xanthomonas sp. BRIP62411]
MNAIDQILQWPVIVQGALGSLLFWIAYEIGSRATNSISKKLGKDKRVALWFSLSSVVSDDRARRDSLRITCLYGALHYAIKAILLFAFAWASSLFNKTFGAVGCFVGIYFLFRALSYVPHFDKFGSEAKAKTMLTELEADLGLAKPANPASSTPEKQ